jgi:hypothetical protein
MSLLKLYTSGIQTDPISYNIVYNANNKYDNQCQNCVKNNTIPNLFYYYGSNLCSKITLPDYKYEYYNAKCNQGHTCILLK